MRLLQPRLLFNKQLKLAFGVNSPSLDSCQLRVRGANVGMTYRGPCLFFKATLCVSLLPTQGPVLSILTPLHPCF